MKKFMLMLLLLMLLIGGLNLSAAGLHRLLPQAPPFVLGLEREDGQLKLRLMDFVTPSISLK